MEYVSYCGLLCNECPVYIATAQNDNLMKAKLAKEYSSESSQFSAHDINCCGCFSETNKLSKICSNCEIRNCAEAKEVKNCGHCDNYPCRYIHSHVPEGSENRKRLDHIRSGF